MNQVYLTVSFPFSSFEKGGISLQSGQNVTNQKTFRSKVFYNDAPMISGQQYLVELLHRDMEPSTGSMRTTHYSLRMYFYDKNKTYLGEQQCIEIPPELNSKSRKIGSTDYQHLDQFVFKFPKNAMYLRFMVYEDSKLKSKKYILEEDLDRRSEEELYLSEQFEIKIQKNPYYITSVNDQGVINPELTVRTSAQNILYSLYDKINLDGIQVFGTFQLPMNDTDYYTLRILNHFKVSNFDTLTLGDSKTFYIQWRGYRGEVIYSVQNSMVVQQLAPLFSSSVSIHSSDTSKNDEGTVFLLKSSSSKNLSRNTLQRGISGTLINQNILRDSNGSEYQITDTNKKYVTLVSVHENSIQGNVLTIPATITTDTNVAYSVTKVGSNCLDLSLKRMIHSLVLEESVGNMTVTLEGQIFENCIFLKDINLKGSITNIGYRCFANTILTSVYLPASITTLGESVFENCQQLKYVVFNQERDGSLNIGKNCFWNIATDSYIYVPSLQRTYDFYVNSHKDTSICLDTRLTKVVVGMVTYADKVLDMITDSSTSTGSSTLNVDDSKEYYVDSHGAIFCTVSDTETTLYSLPSNLSMYVVPTTLLTVDGFYNVVGIRDNAFVGHPSLQKIEFSGPMTLGKYAFQNCKSLMSIESNYSMTYNDGVFDGCENLNISSLLQNITQVPDYLFRNCKNNSTLRFSNQLISLGKECLLGVGVTSIVLPETLKMIGENAFKETSLSEVRVLSPSLESIGNGSFSDISSTCNIVVMNEQMRELFLKKLPGFTNTTIRINVLKTEMISKYKDDYIDHYGVQYRLDTTFKSATIIGNKPEEMFGTTYYIPDTVYLDTDLNTKYSVDSILPGSFQGTGFQTVVLNDLIHELPDRCFSNSDFISLQIPDTGKLTKVGDEAFYNTNITDDSIILPENVLIGKGVFKNCLQLKKIHHILKNIFIFAEEMFSGCTSVETIIIDHKIDFEKDNANVFYNCRNVRDVIFLNNDCTLKKGAFVNAFQEEASQTSIFCSNHGMEEVLSKDLLEKTSEYIDKEYHFETIVYGHASIVEGNKIHEIRSIQNGNEVLDYSLDISGSTVNENLEIHLKKCNRPNNITMIPSIVLCDVLITNSVLKADGITDNTNIESNTNDPRETEPLICKVCTLENAIFQGMEQKEIHFPMTITKLPDQCFKSSSIRKLKFPKYLQELGWECFRRCEKLPAFRSGVLPLPETLEKLGGSVFQEAFFDNGLEIPPLVTYLPKHMCKQCSTLERCYVFSHNLEAINKEGDGLFYKCKGWCAKGGRFEFYAPTKEIAKRVIHQNFKLTGGSCSTSQAVNYHGHSKGYPRTTLLQDAPQSLMESIRFLISNDSFKREAEILKISSFVWDDQDRLEDEQIWYMPATIQNNDGQYYDITTIKTGSLLEDSSIQGISIGRNVSIIEPRGLQNESLTMIQLSSYVGEVISEEMFYGTPNVKEIIIPSNIKCIQTNGFKGSSFKRIIVEGDIIIESNAFQGLDSDCLEIAFLGKVTFQDIENFGDNLLREHTYGTKIYVQDSETWSQLKTINYLFDRIYWVQEAVDTVKSLSYKDKQGIIYCLDGDSREEFIVDSFDPCYSYEDYDIVVNYYNQNPDSGEQLMSKSDYLESVDTTSKEFDTIEKTTRIVIPTMLYVPFRGYFYPVTRVHAHVFENWEQLQTITLDTNLIPTVRTHSNTKIIVNDLMKGNGANGIYVFLYKFNNQYYSSNDRFGLDSNQKSVSYLGSKDGEDTINVKYTIPQFVVDVATMISYPVSNWKQYTPLTLMPNGNYIDYQGLIYKVHPKENDEYDVSVIGYLPTVDLEHIEIPSHVYIPEEE